MSWVLNCCHNILNSNTSLFNTTPQWKEGSEARTASSLSLARVRPSAITNGTNKHSSTTGSSSSSTSSSHSKTQRSASTYHRQRRHSDFCESLFWPLHLTAAFPETFPGSFTSLVYSVACEESRRLDELPVWATASPVPHAQNIPYVSLYVSSLCCPPQQRRALHACHAPQTEPDQHGRAGAAGGPDAVAQGQLQRDGEPQPPPLQPNGQQCQQPQQVWDPRSTQRHDCHHGEWLQSEARGKGRGGRGSIVLGSLRVTESIDVCVISLSFRLQKIKLFQFVVWFSITQKNVVPISIPLTAKFREKNM